MQKKIFGNSSTARIAILSGLIFSLALFVSFSAGAANSVGCRVDIDRGILPAGGLHKAIVKITLDPPPASRPIERPAVNLAIVLDRSGSMNGEKLEKAKDAAIEALRRLGGADLFSLVIYDHNVETIVPAQSARNIEWIEARIRRIYAGGNTALFGGVSQGAAEVRKNLNRGYINRIILLSDGLANVGPDSPDDLGRLGASLLKEDISVTTVGVGMDYNEDLMTRLSQNSDGNSYFVESGRDLPHIFAAELGDVLNVVARRVHIIIECPEGVRPLTIIGREGRIRGNNVELYLNQLYGGSKKYAIVEVEVAGGKEGESRDIALARISYENPFNKQNETASAKASARFSRDLNAVNRSMNVAVAKDYQLNLNVMAQEQAIILSDKGQKHEAVQALQNSAEQLRDFGLQNNDAEMIQKSEEISQQAEDIQKQGMTNKNRKVLRTKSYQMKNQQKSN
ncbi:MAG: VWA domain-containing protein [Desulfobacteraceae bacterium]|nr:MAG: VWA domain-containing protein [Desulfobacteraceae bacterium]